MASQNGTTKIASITPVMISGNPSAIARDALDPEQQRPRRHDDRGRPDQRTQERQQRPETPGNQ